MQIKVATLSKAKLDAIPEAERAFYVHIGHLRNELAILNRLLLWINNNPYDNLVQGSVSLGQGLTITKLLAGKLWEGWELLNKVYFPAKLGLIIEPNLSLTAKKAMQELKAHFRSGSILRKVRNYFAFHYSSDVIRDQLGNLEDADRLEIYWGFHEFNTFYPFSEVAAAKALLASIGGRSDHEAVDRLIKEVFAVTSSFTKFCDWSLLSGLYPFLIFENKTEGR